MPNTTIEQPTKATGVSAADRVLTRLANGDRPRRDCVCSLCCGRHSAGYAVEPTPNYVGVHCAAEQVSA